MSEPRAPRRNYLQLNDGSDEEGDSDNPQPPRSRRRINPTPEIVPNESVSQVDSVSNESVFQAPSVVSQSSSVRRAYKPKPKESWL
jgi:hypothetical protein